MILSDDEIKLIKDLERYLKNIKKYLDICSEEQNEQSLFYQEMKNQYRLCAEVLNKKREELFEKIRMN